MEAEKETCERRKGERGSTKMAELTKLRAKGKRLHLELDAKGNFVGDDEDIAKFPSYLGTCVRSHIPFNIEKWVDVDKTYKVNLWDDLTSVFDFDQTKLTQKKVFSKAARMWTNYKSRLYCQYVYGNKKGEDPCLTNEWLRREVWEDLVRQRSTKEAEGKRKQAQTAANSDLIPHTTSRGGFGKLLRKMKKDKLEDMKAQMESEGKDSSSLSIVQIADPARDQMWKKSKFSKKKGKYVNETCEAMVEKIDKLNELKSQGLFQEKEGTDLLSEVYTTPEHPGRVRGVGFGMGIKEYFGGSLVPRRGPSPRLTHKDVEALVQAQIQSQVILAFSKASQDMKNELYRSLVEVLSDPTQPLTQAKLCEVFGIPSTESSHMLPQCDRLINSEKASCEPVNVSLEDKDEDEIPSQFNIKDDGEIVLVAEGVVTSSRTLHGNILPDDQVRVRVDKVIERYATLPVPNKLDESIVLVRHALHTYVAWPKDLCVPLLRRRKQNTEPPSGKVRDEKGQENMKKLRELCASYKDDYAHEITISEDVVGREHIIYIPREDVLNFIEDKLLDECWVELCMSYLHKQTIRSCKVLYGFISPHFTSSIETRKSRIEYIGRTILDFKRRTVFFTPIIRGGHWSLFMICPRRSTIYYFDSNGRSIDAKVQDEIAIAFSEYGKNGGRRDANKDLQWISCVCPQQPGTTEGGYYIMRLMYDLVRAEVKDNNVNEIITSNVAYSQEQLEEIKELLAQSLLEYV